MRVAWQILVGLLVALGVASTVGSKLAGVNDVGTFGIGFAASNVVPGTLVVQSVKPHSAAADAGIKVGDQLHFELTPANHVIMYATVPGDHLRVRDQNRWIDLVARVDRTPPNAALLAIITVARLAFLMMAALVAWRRPDDPAARALSLFLACLGVGIAFDFGLLPAIWARFASFLFVQSTFMVGGLSAFVFACRFPRPTDRGLRHARARALLPLGSAGFVFSTGGRGCGYCDSPLWPPVRPLLALPYIAWYIAIIVASFIAFIDSYRATDAADRVRVRWVIGTFAIGFSGMIVLFAGIAAGLSGAAAQALQYVSLTTLAIPFGLGYVILRHRMLDIGFVVNRAVVYTGVSIIIVGAFILFEWLVGHVVEVHSSTSTLLQLGAALALGLSARFIHARVDRYVDDFFFRERHLAEAAIRRFAHEALLITDPIDLTSKTVAVAQEHARLSGVAFYARKNERYVALQSTFESATDVSENDYGVLEMRTWHHPVDVLARRSEVPGEIAFPMIVRGKLAGFLACGPKTTHEAFAPDERDALALLARDAGVALDSLRVRAVERELAYLSYDDEIPAALRARLAALVVPD